MKYDNVRLPAHSPQNRPRPREECGQMIEQTAGGRCNFSKFDGRPSTSGVVTSELSPRVVSCRGRPYRRAKLNCRQPTDVCNSPAGSRWPFPACCRPTSAASVKRLRMRPPTRAGNREIDSFGWLAETATSRHPKSNERQQARQRSAYRGKNRTSATLSIHLESGCAKVECLQPLRCARRFKNSLPYE